MRSLPIPAENLWALLGMDARQTRITDWEPIDGAWIHLDLDIEGWNLRIGHKHRIGRHGDCEAEQYSGLTLGECLDVIDATISTLGHG